MSKKVIYCFLDDSSSKMWVQKGFRLHPLPCDPHHLVLFYPYQIPNTSAKIRCISRTWITKWKILDRTRSNKLDGQIWLVHNMITKNSTLLLIGLNNLQLQLQTLHQNISSHIKRLKAYHHRDYLSEQAWSWCNQHHQASYHKYSPTPHSQPRIPAIAHKHHVLEIDQNHIFMHKIEEKQPIELSQTRTSAKPEGRLWKISHTITNSKSSGFYPSNNL